MIDYLKVLAIDFGLIRDENLDAERSKKKQGRNLSTVLLFVIYFIFTSHFLGTICPIQASTGFPCPTCGSTRAFTELIRGNFSEAFAYHPLIILSLLILFIALAYGLRMQVKAHRAHSTGSQIERPKTPNWFLIVAVIIILIYLSVYIYRMINFYPNTAPMQYNYDSVWGRILGLIRE